MTSTLAPAARWVRRRLVLRGVVQGVGMRPYVYVLASGVGLSGFVGNDESSAFIEVEGPTDEVRLFEQRLLATPPRLARIESVEAADLPLRGDASFEIVASEHGHAPSRTLVPADTATCDDCLRELLDPTDRRYRYPFINCTNCGPRFTIIRDLPYDRPATSMAGFELCAECQREYRDPRDRRFHAQPVACAACGPSVRAVGPAAVPGADAIATACRWIDDGLVVAVKGIGGFHLACDASNPDAIAALRSRKQRGDKPFAVMAADVATIRSFAHVGDDELAVLMSPQHPIVLLDVIEGATVPVRCAPGHRRIGVMLPYSPLHHLLVNEAQTNVLVMTSGNHADEPIVTDDETAVRELADLADAFVLHDRPIDMPCDDSVVAVVRGEEQPVRRSRGYAPVPLTLPFDVVPILGVGAEIKNTFCLGQGRHAWLSQHIGDMGSLGTHRAYDVSVRRFERMYEVTPRLLAADPHPRAMASSWARERGATTGISIEHVQHHHAHVAALMAEHGLPLDARVLGVAFDGTGYGTDGTIWGGELLLGGYLDVERLGHLATVPLPGGDAAIRHPARVALMQLHHAGEEWDERLPPVAAVGATGRGLLARQVATGFTCTPTSSMGRLFDAISALLGLRQEADYEAEAAILLEAAAASSIGRADVPTLRFALTTDPGTGALVLDPAPVVRSIVRAHRRSAGNRQEVASLALAFHHAVAEAVATAASTARNQGASFDAVGLTGGVFQNLLLSELTTDALRRAGETVLTHRIVPPNDGGLALGQVAVAGARASQRSHCTPNHSPHIDRSPHVPRSSRQGRRDP